MPTATASPTAGPALLFTRAELDGPCVPGNVANKRTDFTGTVFLNNQPADGYRVVFSHEPDGNWATQPITSGPNPPGVYTHIISITFFRQGSWYTWIVDEAGVRISPMATFTSDGDANSCNHAVINFYG